MIFTSYISPQGKAKITILLTNVIKPEEMANRRCRKRLNAEQQRGKSGELRCASWQWVHRGPEAGGLCSALQGRMGTG